MVNGIRTYYEGQEEILAPTGKIIRTNDFINTLTVDMG